MFLVNDNGFGNNVHILNIIFHVHLYSAYSFNGTLKYMTAQDPLKCKARSTQVGNFPARNL